MVTDFYRLVACSILIGPILSWLVRYVILWKANLIMAFLQFDGTASRFKKNISELWEIIQLFVKERIDTMEANANLDDTDFLTTLLENTASRDPLFLRNIMVTLLFAGRDNTQASSAWALYELSRNPYWMNRMRNEALELDKSGQVPSFSTLSVGTVSSVDFSRWELTTVITVIPCSFGRIL